MTYQQAFEQAQENEQIKNNFYIHLLSFVSGIVLLEFFFVLFFTSFPGKLFFGIIGIWGLGVLIHGAVAMSMVNSNKAKSYRAPTESSDSKKGRKTKKIPGTATPKRA